MWTKHLGARSFFFVCVLYIFTNHLAIAQTDDVKLSKSDFAPLVGKWSGTMLSLETRDDSTLTNTDVSWDVTESDSNLVVTKTIWDEGGNPEVITDPIAFLSGGRRITMDGKGWFVWAKRETQNGTTIVFQGPSTDNYKKAQITYVLYMSVPDSSRQDSVVLTKKVLYENAGREIERSQFRLGRVKE
ncbi:MAG: hypothetical protein IPP40_09330 [bacterium]|nr:hypothetical protein [bacterium]